MSAYRPAEAVVGRQEFSLEAFGERHVRRVIAVEIVPQLPYTLEQWLVPMKPDWEVLVVCEGFCGPIYG